MEAFQRHLETWVILLQSLHGVGGHAWSTLVH